MDTSYIDLYLCGGSLANAGNLRSLRSCLVAKCIHTYLHMSKHSRELILVDSVQLFQPTYICVSMRAGNKSIQMHMFIAAVARHEKTK